MSLLCELSCAERENFFSFFLCRSPFIFLRFFVPFQIIWRQKRGHGRTRLVSTWLLTLLGPRGKANDASRRGQRSSRAQWCSGRAGRWHSDSPTAYSVSAMDAPAALLRKEHKRRGRRSADASQGKLISTRTTQETCRAGVGTAQPADNDDEHSCAVPASAAPSNLASRRAHIGVLGRERGTAVSRNLCCATHSVPRNQHCLSERSKQSLLLLQKSTTSPVDTRHVYAAHARCAVHIAGFVLRGKAHSAVQTTNTLSNTDTNARAYNAIHALNGQSIQSCCSLRTCLSRGEKSAYTGQTDQNKHDTTRRGKWPQSKKSKSNRKPRIQRFRQQLREQSKLGDEKNRKSTARNHIPIKKYRMISCRVVVIPANLT
jgi:hypothetical protein